MVIWGGGYSTYLTTGGQYDPATDTWTPIADSINAVTGRTYNSTVWTGTEMIVWGGLGDGVPVNNGGAYDPATNKWRSLSPPTAPISGAPRRSRRGTAMSASGRAPR